MDFPSEIPPEQSLIVYPCDFPIKVMGANVDGFTEAMAHVARAFDQAFDHNTIEHRPSKAGNYLGLTLKVPLVDLTTVAEIRESKEAASAAYYRAMDRHREVETRISQSWEEYNGAGAKLALSGRKAGALRAALASVGRLV